MQSQTPVYATLLHFLFQQASLWHGRPLNFDAAGTLKISDFGLSAAYELKETGRARALAEKGGSLPQEVLWFGC